MKFTIVTVILTIFLGFNACAQEGLCNNLNIVPSEEHQEEKPSIHQEKKKYPTKEEIMSQKIAFFTGELDLTPDEAQKFWPVYNEGWKKGEAARKLINTSLRKLHDAIKAEPETSDTEIKALMAEYFKACEDEIKIQSETFEEISKVLPVKKAAKVFSLEERFRIMLIRQLRK